MPSLCPWRSRSWGALSATVLTIMFLVPALQVGASYPEVPWTITHANDLAPVSSGARYAWCDLTFEAHKGDLLEVGWHADGPVGFDLYGPDGSRLLCLDLCPTHNLTWDVGTGGAHRASWCNPTTRSNIRINYTVTLKHGGGDGSSQRTRWALPTVHIDASRILDILPYVAVLLISVLFGEVGVAVVSHRARHPGPATLKQELRDSYTAAYCPYPPEAVIVSDGTPGPGAPAGPLEPRG